MLRNSVYYFYFIFPIRLNKYSPGSFLLTSSSINWHSGKLRFPLWNYLFIYSLVIPFYMLHLYMCTYTWCSSNLEKKTSFMLHDEWGCCPYVCLDYMSQSAWTNTYKYIHTHLQTAAGICTCTLALPHIYHTHILLHSNFIVLLFLSLS